MMPSSWTQAHKVSIVLKRIELSDLLLIFPIEEPNYYTFPTLSHFKVYDTNSFISKRAGAPSTLYSVRATLHEILH